MSQPHHIEDQGAPETPPDLFALLKQAADKGKPYHPILDHLLEGLQVLDSEFRYLYVNPALVQQSKFPKEQLLGRTMREVYPGIERTALFRTLEECLDSGEAKLFENEFRYPDGTSSWFELSIQPVSGGLVILSNDISSRKQAELEKNRQLHTLERLLFMASHNLRQPITQIQGLVQLLKSEIPAPGDFSRITSYLEQASGSLETHTREITAFIHNMEIKTRK